MKRNSNPDFFAKVFSIVKQIPVGKVTTYGAIARAVGLKSSARMVGWALNSLAYSNSDIPAHRVVNRKGELTGKKYFPTPTFMEEMLKSEGIKFIGECVDLKNHLWEPKIH
ncbi:MAG: MGMT family protein [Candidatus Kapaibacteriales bacterium]